MVGWAPYVEFITLNYLSSCSLLLNSYDEFSCPRKCWTGQKRGVPSFPAVNVQQDRYRILMLGSKCPAPNGFRGSTSTYDHTCWAPGIVWRDGQGGRGRKGKQNESQAKKERFILSPTRKAQSRAVGSCAMMTKIRQIHLSLVWTDWWLLFWKCTAWIMFSFNYCVLVQDPEDGPFPPPRFRAKVYICTHVNTAFKPSLCHTHTHTHTNTHTHTHTHRL